MKEQGISPETVWGSEFRVPSIVGQGTGRDFTFANLHLPRNWEQAIPKLKEANLFPRLEFYCKQVGLVPGEVETDANTGILTRLTIKTEPLSELYLARDMMGMENGAYRAENITDLKAAIVLQAMCARFLNYIQAHLGSPKIIPYIEIGENSYGSVDLKPPKEVLTAKDVTNSFFQEAFKLKASNIAGRFGLTIKLLRFDKNGLLDDVSVNEGNACSYFLEGREYGTHNVDTPYQAAAMHCIVADFINFLLEKQERENA